MKNYLITDGVNMRVSRPGDVRGPSWGAILRAPESTASLARAAKAIGCSVIVRVKGRVPA